MTDTDPKMRLLRFAIAGEYWTVGVPLCSLLIVLKTLDSRSLGIDQRRTDLDIRFRKS